MKFKLIELINFNKNSQAIFFDKLPLQCAYKMSKIQKEIGNDIEFYQTKFNELLNEYAQKDDNGNFKLSEDKQTILLISDKADECKNKIKELEEMEIELNIDSYLLDITDFGNEQKMSMEEISGLLPFMK